MTHLQHRVAIVTGAARGIGAAIARAMAAEGATLVLADLDHDAASALARDLGPRHRAIRTDIAAEGDPETLARTAFEAFGRIDILVNNAGIGVNGAFMDTTAHDMERAMRINLTGAMLCSQAALRRMIPAGYGRVVNITSISGQRGSSGRTAYGASKAALELMTKVMAVELGPHGITANAVAPGAVETEMAAALHDAETRRLFMDRTPAGRYATPAEVAAVCVFLASEAAAYVNGQAITVDGGLTTAGIVLPRTAA